MYVYVSASASVSVCVCVCEICIWIHMCVCNIYTYLLFLCMYVCMVLPYIQSREMRGGSGAMELKAQSMYDKIEEKLKAGPLHPKLHHQHHYQH
jgi:hypothetical protein